MLLSNNIVSTPAAADHLALPSLAQRLGVLAYGVVAYGLGVAALVAWTLAMLGVVHFSGGPALALNLALLVAFGLQHSVMARPSRKSRWLRVVGSALERPTYMLATVLVLLPILWLWQPMPTVFWKLEHPVSIAAAGRSPRSCRRRSSAPSPARTPATTAADFCQLALRTGEAGAARRRATGRA